MRQHASFLITAVVSTHVPRFFCFGVVVIRCPCNAVASCHIMECFSNHRCLQVFIARPLLPDHNPFNRCCQQTTFLLPLLPAHTLAVFVTSIAVGQLSYFGMFVQSLMPASLPSTTAVDSTYTLQSLLPAHNPFNCCCQQTVLRPPLLTAHYLRCRHTCECMLCGVCVRASLPALLCPSHV